MRNRFCLGIALAFVLTLCGCNTARPTDSKATPTTEASNPATTQATAADPTTAATEAVTEPAAPVHSPLYLPEYTPEQIWEYFEEVVLHMEYSDGTGNPALVQKWKKPLYYKITGKPTDEDLAILDNLFAQLNAVPGFPGIHPAAEGELSNLNIWFLNDQDFQLAFSAALNGEYAYGATQFWYYTATNELYTANIGYRTSIDQKTRSSILVEEIINTLGITDTVVRTDSIVYQYSDENLTLSDVDWVILKLLYNPAMQCGMNFDQCRAIVQELYY